MWERVRECVSHKPRSPLATQPQYASCLIVADASSFSCSCHTHQEPTLTWPCIKGLDFCSAARDLTNNLDFEATASSVFVLIPPRLHQHCGKKTKTRKNPFRPMYV